MKTLSIFLLTATIAIITSGCTKVIDVKLPTAPPKLVIDASIDWEKNTSGNEQKIILTTSTSYYNEEFPAVSGATVYIVNSSNTTFNFTEGQKAGTYICNDFIPVVGETYTLTVKVNDITYTGTEKLMKTPDLDPEIIQTKDGGMTGDEMEIQWSYMDDGSEDNYYLSKVVTNRLAFPSFDIESDENYQGRKMTEFHAHEDLKSGDSANIKLHAVSRRFFDYFRKVLSASGGDGSPFPIIPTPARGNINNQKNPDDYPLGYFRLSQVSTINYVLK